MDRPEAVSQCARTDNYGGLRGIKWCACEGLEGGTPELADETGLTIKVRYCPPGTSKWNKIEHPLFWGITQNWRGPQLTDHATISDLIAATATKTGLKVEAVIDMMVYDRESRFAMLQQEWTQQFKGGSMAGHREHEVWQGSPNYEALAPSCASRLKQV
jgi:hypothetical protein